VADAPAVFRHFADEAVTRFMDIPPCREMCEAEEIIRFHLEDSGCRWGLFAQGSDEWIGTCGFHCWEGRQAEIGFDLRKESWGKGLMREALRPVIDFGFTQMQLDAIVATAEPQNERSIKLLLGQTWESGRA
jgi:ribosomal-protein-alanine N-acetyltransferase